MTKKKRLLFSFVAVFLLLVAGYSIENYRHIRVGLQIETEPQARVVINGQEKGKTPIDLELSEKQISLELIPVGGHALPYETTLSLTPQIKTIVRRKFSEKPLEASTEQISFTPENAQISTLTIVTKPADTQILIDDTVKLTAPQKISVIEGSHKITLFSPNFEQKEILVQAVKGYNLTLYAELAFVTAQATTESSSLGRYTILPGFGSITLYKDASLASLIIGQVKSNEAVEGVARDERNQLMKIITSDGKTGWIVQRYASPSAETK